MVRRKLKKLVLRKPSLKKKTLFYDDKYFLNGITVVISLYSKTSTLMLLIETKFYENQMKIITFGSLRSSKFHSENFKFFSFQVRPIYPFLPYISRNVNTDD